VEYKRGILRHEESFAVQLCAQALCLEEMLQVPVPAGALFYGLSRRRQDVTFDEALRGETEAAARRLHTLIENGKTPPATYAKKCESCSLKLLCLPKTVGRGKSAREYLEGMVFGV
jgi:CRISPR-associated exonuclease Cas4